MFRTILQSLAFVLFSGVCAVAQDLPAPEGDVLLTVSGAVTAQNAETGVELDFAMLEALERRRVETSTIWTEGTQVFEGVSLSVLVDALGLEGSTLRASAVNDYAVEIPMSDAVEGGPIIAYLLNGKEMSLRDKGPLWIIYPYDENSDFRSEVIYSRSIWQLNRIEAIE